jgi:hypothetical protein
MTSSPLALSLFRHPSLSLQTYISPFPSRSLHLCAAICVCIFPATTAGCVPGSLSRPVVGGGKAARMQNTRTPTLSAPMQTHIYLSAFPHMRANGAALFLLLLPGCKTHTANYESNRYVCVCERWNCCKREESIHIRERYVLSGLSRYI